MKNRLTTITTRKGDKGQTNLGNGKSVDKDSLRIEVIGTIDELNSTIGIVLSSKDVNDSIHKILITVQKNLFDCAGELSIPEHVLIKDEHIKQLESFFTTLNAELSPLKEFILPGGHPAAANCHLARSICRRAERRLVTLSKTEKINPDTIIYLNRLSDLLFVIARTINKNLGIKEELWR